MIKPYNKFKINDKVTCTFSGSSLTCIGIILGDFDKTIEVVLAISLPNRGQSYIIPEFGWHSRYTIRNNPKYKPYNEKPRFIHSAGWQLTPLNINDEDTN